MCWEFVNMAQGSDRIQIGMVWNVDVSDLWSVVINIYKGIKVKKEGQITLLESE